MKKRKYTTVDGRKNSHSHDCAESKCAGSPPYDGTNEFVCPHCGEFMPCEGHKCQKNKKADSLTAELALLRVT